MLDRNVRPSAARPPGVRDAIAFDGPVVEWRGPAPFYFVSVPRQRARVLHAMARHASYGWGCVPVVATIGATEFRTSLFPKDGGYLLPLKAAVRRELRIAPGEIVHATLRIWSLAATPDADE